MKKILLGVLWLSIFGIFAFLAKSFIDNNRELSKLNTQPDYLKTINTTFTKTDEPKKDPLEELKANHTFKNPENFHIALLGIDRRNRGEAYRTDVMIILSVNTKTNKALLTSIPRDLWITNKGRVNGIFITEGPESFLTALSDITGFEVNKYILTDFKDFSWLIDSAGGVEVNVETTFTDNQYPVDETFEYQTITFTQGKEVLTGRRALIYSRSRKGNNGEGGDWSRMKRQHNILKGLLTAIKQPKSIFANTNVEEAFNTLTTNKLDTNLTLSDAAFLYDMYKDKDKYKIESIFMNHEYVFNPPLADYGGAWVLRPINNNFSNFRNHLKTRLNDVNLLQEKPVEGETTDNKTTQTNQKPQ